MGTHPIFESDFDCLTEMITGLESKQKHESGGGEGNEESDNETPPKNPRLEPDTSNKLSILPPEIWVKIQSLLEYDAQSVESLASTCKYLNRIHNEHFTWKQLYKHHYPSTYDELNRILTSNTLEGILQVANWKKQYKICQVRKTLEAREIEFPEYSKVCPKVDSFIRINSSTVKLPIQCVFWDMWQSFAYPADQNDIQIGQLIILETFSNSGNSSIQKHGYREVPPGGESNVRIYRICSKTLKESVAGKSFYSFMFQQIQIEDGELKACKEERGPYLYGGTYATNIILEVPKQYHSHIRDSDFG